MLAIALAIFLGSGQLMANQAAVSAALVATIQPPTAGRHVRALPRRAGRAARSRCSSTPSSCRPTRVATIRRAARPVLDELAATLDDIAAAIVAPRSRARRRGARARAGDRRADRALRRRRRRPGGRPRATRRRGGGSAARVEDYATRGDPDRPRRPQRPRARARHDPGDPARRERPAARSPRRVRDLAAAVRAFGAASRTRSASTAVREPALRAAATAPRRCSRRPATCRSA